MSLIDKNTNFQLTRGGIPGNYEGCHDEVLELKDTVEVVTGEMVSFDSVSEKFIKTIMVDAGFKMPFYTIIEGNALADSYSGAYVGKAAAVRGTYQVSTKNFDPTDVAVGGYMTIIDGKFYATATAAHATKPAVGLIRSYDSVNEIVVVDVF